MTLRRLLARLSDSLPMPTQLSTTRFFRLTQIRRWKQPPG